MNYFDQIHPINDILTKVMSINLTEIIFETLLRKKYFRPTTKFLRYVRPHFGQIWLNFSQKGPFLKFPPKSENMIFFDTRDYASSKN